jgi:hypothetical protein
MSRLLAEKVARTTLRNMTDAELREVIAIIYVATGKGDPWPSVLDKYVLNVRSRIGDEP